MPITRMGMSTADMNAAAVAFADGTQQTTTAPSPISPVFTGGVKFSGNSLSLTSAGLGGVYTGAITGGDNNAYAGGSFTVTGFTNGANNGVDLLVTASTPTTLTLANPSTVVESNPATAVTAGVVNIAGSLLDNSGSAGAPNQVLLSTGPGMAWSNQSALALGVGQVTGAAPLASPTFTGTINGITHTMVGADAAGTAATAAATAQTNAQNFTTAQLVNYAPTVSPAFTGNVGLPPFTATLGTTLIGAGAAATLVTVPVAGLLATGHITWSFASDPTNVTGYGIVGGLVISVFATSGNANFSVINPTASGITPGAMTLNFRTVN